LCDSLRIEITQGTVQSFRNKAYGNLFQFVRTSVPVTGGRKNWALVSAS